jgi:magnesium transporter
MRVAPLSLLGIAIATVSCLLSTIALLIMKRSADTEVGLPICKRKLWLAGFTLNTTSELVLTSLAMSLAPLSLIAPVAGMSIVFSAILAHFGAVAGLRERLTGIDWVCTALVLFGVLLASAFGPQNDKVPDYHRAQRAFATPAMLFFTFTCLSVITCWTVFWLAPVFRKQRPSVDSLITSFFSGYSAAACGAFSQLFLKIIMVAVRTLINGESYPLGMPITWASAVGLALCAPLQLYLLNMTLASGAVTFTVPLYTSLIMILTIAAGGLLFEEFVDIDKGFIIAFCTAVLSVMVGLFILSHRQQARPRALCEVCALVAL